MRPILQALLVLLLAAGCGREASVAAPKDAAARRAAGEIYVAVQDDAKTLDPHKASDAGSMRMAENLYATLLRYTPVYGEVEPDLAEWYEVSPDGLTYTFRLRAGARFHGSGREVTSNDVRYSVVSGAAVLHDRAAVVRAGPGWLNP